MDARRDKQRVSASYGGRQGAANLVVTAEDALRIDSGEANQGDFTPGSTVTMWLQAGGSKPPRQLGTVSVIVHLAALNLLPILFARPQTGYDVASVRSRSIMTIGSPRS